MDLVSLKQRFGVIGNSELLNRALEVAVRVAPTDLSVLVTGESGVGKEFFPQVIHAYSARKHNKYIAVNCGAIPEGTIDSELFGHEKGAFTGAVEARKGYFEEADGGTIFLDEVAELPHSTQVRLLRVLQTGEFIRVGSAKVQKTNVRVVAATNTNLQDAIQAGRFREDLYYRLSTVHITVPPLRDRGGDIRLLARKFATDFAERYHTPAITFDENSTVVLSHYPWPGNVRQLKNVVEQIALFEAGNSVTPDMLRSYLPEAPTSFTPAVSVDGSHSYAAERELLFNMLFRMRNEIDTLRATIETMESGMPRDIRPFDAADPVEEPPHSLVRYAPLPHLYPQPHAAQDVVTENSADSGMTLEDTERETIRRALERNEGRRKATATELNISERTLYRKIKEFGLE